MSAPRPRPKVASLAVELTPFCNQACAYCYNPWRGDDAGAAAARAPDTATLLARLARLLDAWDLGRVTLTGGEPFARRDVFDVIAFLRERGVAVQIISNGGLVDDAIAERLRPLGPAYVQVTLNGPDAALHEEHSGPGCFDRTLAGIRALLRAGVPVAGCTVVTRRNAARMAEILDLWRSLGVRRVAVSRFSPAGHAAANVALLLPSRADAIAAFEQALPFARDHGMRIASTMPLPPCAFESERFAPIRFGSCSVGTAAQEFALGPDGRLRQCTLHRGALGGGADVMDPALDLAAMPGAAEVAGYRARAPAFCDGCLHARSCGGGCLAAAEWTTGARAANGACDAPDPFVWQHVDDDFGARLAAERDDGRRRLEVVSP